MNVSVIRPFVRPAGKPGPLHGINCALENSATSHKTPSSVPASGSPGGNVETAVKPLPTIHPFVLPYKRFAATCLVENAQRYLHDDKQNVTYRNSVKHDRQRIGYPLQNTASENTLSRHQPVVDHSLVWRMVGWLGGLTLALGKARQMILQKNPNSLCQRPTSRIASHKARSDQRLATLQTALELLDVIPEWEELHGEKFFPRFATRSGFD